MSGGEYDLSTADLDPVEVLRQRVAAAMRGHVAALGLSSPGTELTEALGAFEAELDDSDPADLAVQAVARALVGEAETDNWPACSQCGGSGYQPCAPGSPLPAAQDTHDGAP